LYVLSKLLENLRKLRQEFSRHHVYREVNDMIIRITKISPELEQKQTGLQRGTNGDIMAHQLVGV